MMDNVNSHVELYKVAMGEIIRIIARFIFLLALPASDLIAQNSPLDDSIKKKVDSLRNMGIPQLAKHATKKDLKVLMQDDLPFFYKVSLEQYEIAERAYDDEKMCAILVKLGNCEIKLGMLEKARFRLYKAIEKTEILNSPFYKSLAMILLADISYQELKLPEAVDRYHKSIELGYKIKDEPEKRLFLNNRNIALGMIGAIYIKVQMFDEAKEYIKKAKVGYEKLNDMNGIEFIYNLESHMYVEQRNYSKALKCQLKRLDLLSEDDKFHYANGLQEVGIIYARLKNIDLASSYLKRALVYNEEMGHKLGVVTCRKELLEIVNTTDKNVESVLIEGQEIIEAAKEINALEMVQQVSNLLYKIYKEYGKDGLALEMNELYQETSIQLKVQEQSEELKLEAIRNDLMEQKRQNEAEKQKSVRLEKNKRIFLSWVFTVCFMFCLGLVFFLLRKIKSNQKVRESLMLKKRAFEDNSRENSPIISMKNMNESLEREIISDYCGNKLNDTDWNILEFLMSSPKSTNREIAAHIFMSYDAVLSSLKKMYKLFDINVK